MCRGDERAPTGLSDTLIEYQGLPTGLSVRGLAGLNRDPRLAAMGLCTKPAALCDRRLGLRDDCVKFGRIRNRQIGEHLAIQLDPDLGAAVDKLAIAKPPL